MGAVKHAVRVVSDSGAAIPARRQPPLVLAYENFRLGRQNGQLSPKTLEYYDNTTVLQRYVLLATKRDLGSRARLDRSYRW